MRTILNDLNKHQVDKGGFFIIELRDVIWARKALEG